MRIKILIVTLLTLFLIACNVDNIKQYIPMMTKDDDTLQKLDSGKNVTQLQEELISLGYPIEATGEYDEKTVWAVTDLQLEADAMYVNGVYNDSVQYIIDQHLAKKFTVQSPYYLPKPEQADVYTDVIENPYDVLAVVNKNFALPSDYQPLDLIVPDVRFPFEEDLPQKQLRKEAAEALENLFTSAENAGIHLFAQSGFRSFERQEQIFTAFAEQDGEEAANKYSARPGESEHQTGLVMDITAESVNFQLTTEFGDTEEGIWVAKHAHEHGFVIRYPKGKESITQYDYEPWHLRYVGIKAATVMYNNNETLEEYLSVTQ